MQKGIAVTTKGGSRHKNLYMTRVLGFLIRYFSNYYTLHRSDLAARAAPLDPHLTTVKSSRSLNQRRKRLKSYRLFSYGVGLDP